MGNSGEVPGDGEIINTSYRKIKGWQVTDEEIIIYKLYVGSPSKPGMTLREIADRLQVSKSHIANIVNNAKEKVG